MSSPAHNPSARSSCLSCVAGTHSLADALETCGYADAEGLIRHDRVTVNGLSATRPRKPIHPRDDVIEVDGVPVLADHLCSYIAVHKPYRVLSEMVRTVDGRSSLLDIVPLSGLYAVGRLDYDSEGLVLLTDDGWMAHRLTHPRFSHPKTYLVQVEGMPNREALAALAEGVLVKGRKTKKAEVTLLSEDEQPRVPPRTVPIQRRPGVAAPWLYMVLREGRNRQIRHMTAAVGHPTLRLIRVAIGPVALCDMEPGQWRHLDNSELAALEQMLLGGG